MEARLYFFDRVDSNRPIDCKYITEIDEDIHYFVEQDDAILYLFDRGVREYKYLTKEYAHYVNPSKVLKYELWHIENRVGYVLYDYERYVDENGVVKKRRAWVFRFLGPGRSCFAATNEELKEKVTSIIQEYKKDIDRGFNTYPFYTRYHREKVEIL